MLYLWEKKQKRLKSNLISLAERYFKINLEMKVPQNSILLVLIRNTRAIHRNILIKEKSSQHSSFGGTAAQIKIKFKMTKNQNCHLNPRKISGSIGKTIKEPIIMVQLKEKQIGRIIDFQIKTKSKTFTRTRSFLFRKWKMNSISKMKKEKRNLPKNS